MPGNCDCIAGLPELTQEYASFNARVKQIIIQAEVASEQGIGTAQEYVVEVLCNCCLPSEVRNKLLPAKTLQASHSRGVQTVKWPMLFADHLYLCLCSSTIDRK